MNEPDNYPQHPESLMMSHGYKPWLSEGSLKCPIFQTSTFVFKSAAEGKAFFELAYGLREKNSGEELGLIYSRLNNPDLEILEGRLAIWDEAEDSAVFESGMAAISTVMLEFLRPGQSILYSSPLYGGTHHFIHKVLPGFGINPIGFYPDESEEAIYERAYQHHQTHPIGLIFVETPSNPTNQLIDLNIVKRIADRLATPDHPVITACDNTFMGPMWQKPLRHGIDLALYSATKFIGGHSDLIAGSVSGKHPVISRIKVLRTFLGNMAGPWTGWLLMRSLETLKVRTDRMAINAEIVANFLATHPKVNKVLYIGFAREGTNQWRIRDTHCLANGSMISFIIQGGECEAFQFLDSLRLFRLAVSLGGTESLAEHPASMTHADIGQEEKQRLGIHEGLIRLSIGVEHPDDLIADLTQALSPCI